MGVKYLNTFIKKNAPNALKYVSLSSYSGKTIAIDTSIYMHKYLASNSLMESMYFMMSQFKYLNITPIFVFDGYAPAEKRGTLNAREATRQNALQKYNHLNELLEHEQDQQHADNQNVEDQDDASQMQSDEITDQLRRQMRTLKRRFIRLNNSEINDLKRLMREYGIQYIESDSESDLLCAYLVKSGIAQVCMSDDMDMFLYNCPVVLRDVNIWHGTGVEYTMSSILNGLGVSVQGFRMACILSGTDYTFNCSYPSSASSSYEDETESPRADALSSENEKNEKNEMVSFRRIYFKLYLSDLVNDYINYTQTQKKVENVSVYEYNSDSDSENKFDDDFYEWVVDAHKKHVSTNKMELDMIKRMFEKAYSIFSSEPGIEMKERVKNIAIAMNDDGSTVTPTPCIPGIDSGLHEIPYKVKRIMAKYNFIYLT